MVRKSLALAMAATLASVSTAQAGLFDFLFAPRKPAPIVSPAPRPTVPIVKPRVAKAARSGRTVKARSRKPGGDRAIFVDPKAQLAATIDPVRNPDWHLIDPTLRRGDILVLADRVLVFAGGRIGAPASYVSLRDDRTLGRKLKTQVAAMTGQGRLPPLLASKEPPRQPQLLRQASVMPPVLGAPRRAEQPAGS